MSDVRIGATFYASQKVLRFIKFNLYVTNFYVFIFYDYLFHLIMEKICISSQFLTYLFLTTERPLTFTHSFRIRKHLFCPLRYLTMKKVVSIFKDYQMVWQRLLIISPEFLIETIIEATFNIFSKIFR